MANVTVYETVRALVQLEMALAVSVVIVFFRQVQ